MSTREKPEICFELEARSDTLLTSKRSEKSSLLVDGRRDVDFLDLASLVGRRSLRHGWNDSPGVIPDSSNHIVIPTACRSGAIVQGDHLRLGECRRESLVRALVWLGNRRWLVPAACRDGAIVESDRFRAGDCGCLGVVAPVAITTGI